jgi:hypothetical protein
MKVSCFKIAKIMFIDAVGRIVNKDYFYRIIIKDVSY